MTINEAYRHLKNDLTKIYDAKESANIANLVIEKISGLKKTDRILNKQNFLDEQQINTLNNYSQELINHKPVQYVLKESWFAGIKFYVDENVLIPRPETEELVEWIIRDSRLTIHDSLLTINNSQLTILDIGTGSGCIAVALKRELKSADVYALDVSEQALKIAAKNAKQNHLDIHFFNADILFIDIKINLPLFDIIVSNPPYVTKKESAEMHSNVFSHEPHFALFVPDENPLLFYNAISNFALYHLNQNGSLYFEINEGFEKKIATLLQEEGFQSVEIKKDLQGKNRMIKAVYSTI